LAGRAGTAEARGRALVAASAMIGAVTMSRVVSDPELSAELLSEVEKSLTGGGAPAGRNLTTSTSGLARRDRDDRANGNASAQRLHPSRLGAGPAVEACGDPGQTECQGDHPVRLGDARGDRGQGQADECDPDQHDQHEHTWLTNQVRDGQARRDQAY